MHRHTLLLSPLLLVAGCATAPAPIHGDEVQAMLDTQREAWNRGDLEAFMATYWRSPDLTFVGGSGITRGHAETLARYRAAYPDATSRGRLDFELLEVRPIGDGTAALVIGRWRLTREAPASGIFTLVVERAAGGLRIVHDHSSSDA